MLPYLKKLCVKLLFQALLCYIPVLELYQKSNLIFWMGKGASSPLAWWNRTFSGSPLVAQIWIIISITNLYQHQSLIRCSIMRGSSIWRRWGKTTHVTLEMCVSISALPLSPKALVYRLPLIQTDPINIQGLFCRYHLKYVWTHRHRKVRLGPMSQKEALEQKEGFLNLVPSPSCCPVAMTRKAQKYR